MVHGQQRSGAAQFCADDTLFSPQPPSTWRKGRQRDVCGTSSRRAPHQCEHRRLLDPVDLSQRHGSSPITATAGPLRTLSRKPEGAAISFG